MDLILLIGQSNAKGCGNPETSEIPQGGTFEYVENITGNARIPLGVTLQFSEGRGTVAPALCNTLQEKTGRQVCIVHYAVDGSRIKNWNHDKWMYLDEAIAKFKNAEQYIRQTHPIDKKAALWIQGESDAKYGTDPIYYKKQLLSIGARLKKECKVETTFVSMVGYWLGDEDYLKRCERIAVMQERVCMESDDFTLISKTAMTFPKRNLLQDEVHYSMKALNELGKEFAEAMVLYYNGRKNGIPSDCVDLTEARNYIDKLEQL